MRLFVALEIPSSVRDNLAALVKDLRMVDSTGRKSTARWARAENLHVTLKFIGHIDGKKLDAIRGALAEVRSRESVALCFQGLGFFPNEKRARVLWAGVTASANLPVVAASIDTRFETLQVPRETRAFAPHLTLARLEPPGVSDRLRAAIQENATRNFGEFKTNEFHLFESKTRAGGAEYTRLSSFSFAPAEA